MAAQSASPARVSVRARKSRPGLPLVVGTPVDRDAAQAGAEPSASALAGLTVLVVEDSEDAREALRALLELLGATVSVADDGREARDMIEDVAPDLVLCDHHMPRMDGFEFMSEVLRGSARSSTGGRHVRSCERSHRKRTRDADSKGYRKTVRRGRHRCGGEHGAESSQEQ